jgi:hypothetical protein
MLHKKSTPALALALALLGLFSLSACAPSARMRRADEQKRKKIEMEALKHYRLGIDAYTDDRYAEAINEWKQVLALDPKYPNAEDYIKRAETMEKALKRISKKDKDGKKAALTPQAGPIGVSGMAQGLSGTGR